MRTDTFDNRFGGTQRLYGSQGIEQLKQAHVAVVGMGGVGSWIVEALARTAIGELTLFDLDDICVSNTNRQIHAHTGNFGKDKVEAMVERVKLINPECKVNAVEDFVTTSNVREVLSTNFDYLIDATDSVQAKAGMIAWCKRNKVKVITIGGAGGQIDPSQIQIGDLAKTIQDPLLAKVRNQLRRDYNFSKNPKRKFGVEAIFSTEQLKYPASDGQVCLQKPAQGEGPAKLDCATGFGASTVVTATFGFFAASRVINKISGLA
ncbi:tRNA cyclic N6-threonylcarbamoyladenosine(37) synthase TcdA [Catenovulum sp. SM1970]|uniref:tRNA cyclic N6-threonylcarbamoyladenosine(37) synthase TcdA n=1 Tax=Marinifaba aquimaris TaxID=2741323 RepID=UPI0015735E9A|nr:tRNA cyclic N6-threonylcarbamoyladenosine(37) synthase TcdA [Marinifaba aquimaris]NTS76497.1 tRNA cyclic N6-threonylcarbamoyladenosine(37) synthase TcdA [Marinifaba aquimaris]